LKSFVENHPYAPVIPVIDRIFETTSEYQHIEVYATEDLGNMLVLDGAVQTTEKDEFIYHESMAMPAIALSENAKKILIIGGGDGGVAKELLRVDKDMSIEIVDIDGAVPETSRRFLPAIASALDKVRITTEDGLRFIRENSERRDVIIVDSTDPTPMAEGLFSKEFYRKANELCDVFVAQTESPIANRDAHVRAVKNMEDVFEHVYTYYACIPTYPGALFSFTLGMKEKIGRIRDIPVKTRYYSKDLFLASMKDFSKWIME